LKQAEKWSGDKARRMYIPRHFDLRFKKAKPGLFVPNLLDKVDHIINVFRLSSHVWSQYTMAIKNWVGIMRPDNLQLVFDEKNSPFAVSSEKRAWITEDALRAPKCKLHRIQ
jgi:hypothetical protein